MAARKGGVNFIRERLVYVIALILIIVVGSWLVYSNQSGASDLGLTTNTYPVYISGVQPASSSHPYVTHFQAWAQPLALTKAPSQTDVEGTITIIDGVATPFTANVTKYAPFGANNQLLITATDPGYNNAPLQCIVSPSGKASAVNCKYTTKAVNPKAPLPLSITLNTATQYVSYPAGLYIMTVLNVPNAPLSKNIVVTAYGNVASSRDVYIYCDRPDVKSPSADILPSNAASLGGKALANKSTQVSYKCEYKAAGTYTAVAVVKDSTGTYSAVEPGILVNRSITPTYTSYLRNNLSKAAGGFVQ